MLRLHAARNRSTDPGGRHAHRRVARDRGADAARRWITCLGSRRPDGDHSGAGNRSEPSVKHALREAFEISVRGALAMGLKHMRVDGARVLPDAVILAMVATDEDDDAGEEVETR